MKLSHAGIIASDLELMRQWYCRYFGLSSGPKFCDAASGLSLYFLSWPGDGAQIEILHYDGRDVTPAAGHVAVNAGSREAVDYLTSILRADGHQVVMEPAVSLVGSYMSAVLDPEGNTVEIVDR